MDRYSSLVKSERMEPERKTIHYDLKRDLSTIRAQFPILERCTYLISNSLGAVPRQVRESLERYYSLWAEMGVSAWEQEWWGLARRVGDQVAAVIGAKTDEVTMLTHATQCHWVALSTQFRSAGTHRRKIIMTDQDFPSSIYAVSQIAAFMGWEVDKVESGGAVGIPWERIAEHIDESTLLVATSHVHFRSAYIQDIKALSAYAHEKGAMTLIDAYHGPGTIPVEVRDLDVDFYIGGCLKWLCGGPGNAFLYVNPEIAGTLEPELTGWMAHAAPFDFSQEVDLTQGAYRFMSGTPPMACLYTATAGLDMIQAIGIEAIRKKSKRQTQTIIDWARDRGYEIFSPIQTERRAGAVSLGLSQAQRVYRALEERGIKVDFRKGRGAEADVIRVGPHFYTEDSELEHLFTAIESVGPL